MFFLLFVLFYLLVGMVVKAYFKLFRWDRVMDYEPLLIGIFWPIYITWRTISWSFNIPYSFIERKMSEAKRVQDHKEYERILAQVQQEKTHEKEQIERELQEAEEEVEEVLSQRNHL